MHGNIGCVNLLESGTETGDQLVAANRSRSTAYGFLSKVYEKEVTVDFLNQLTGSDFISQINIMGEDEGFRLLSTYLKGLAGRDLKQVRLELAVEYAALFLGLRGGVYHPSESAYTSSTHWIMRQARDNVMTAYRKAYVEKMKSFSEPEDHIAVELQFMSYLCEKTADAMQGGQKSEGRKWLEMQKEFMNQHILVWVPKFTEDLMKAAELDFYRAIAKITNEFVRVDSQAIEDLVERIDRA
jgi:TorA maturation chaperone TorD